MGWYRTTTGQYLEKNTQTSPSMSVWVCVPPCLAAWPRDGSPTRATYTARRRAASAQPRDITPITSSWNTVVGIPLRYVTYCLKKPVPALSQTIWNNYYSYKAMCGLWFIGLIIFYLFLFFYLIWQGFHPIYILFISTCAETFRSTERADMRYFN